MYSDIYESEESDDVLCCDRDDDMLEIEKDLDNVDEMEGEARTTRTIVEIKTYVTRCMECDLYGPTKDASRLIPINEKLAPLPSTIATARSFLVMDTEVFSFGKTSKKKENPEGVHFVPLEVTFAICKETPQGYTDSPAEHFFINPGNLTDSIYIDDKRFSTYSFNVKGCHGIGITYSEDGTLVPKGSRSDFLAIWKRISALAQDNGNVIVAKSARDEKLTLMWILEMARQEDPSLPDSLPFNFVDANNFKEVLECLVEPLWYAGGEKHPQKPDALLPYSELCVSYEVDTHEAYLGAWSPCERCYADMDGGCMFTGGVARYLNENTLRHVLAVHEARLWACDDEMCDFHKIADPLHNEYFPHDMADEKGRPFHMHCSKKDTMALAKGLTAVLSMK
eukprot:TRINITY_DN3644_c0_g1_i1.p1 TRINITY_DN3644_c0_g1~~TRINITY_DN3644_c0_g1_i1.p1  ORF type:complete len:410 (+),score=133.46 TRINITY_DN3644_c0_g1_i1:48-1232(+)